jgi:hypothetical protein
MRIDTLVGTRLTCCAMSAMVLLLAGCNRLDSPRSTASTAASPAKQGNSAPTIAGVPAGAVAVGTEYRFVPSVADADGDILKFSISNLPPWANFSTASGELVGTPQAADAGTYGDILITVSDGTLATPLAAFSIVVVPGALGTATLSWLPPTLNEDGTPLIGLAGFKVYYGTDSASLNKLVTLNDASLVRYQITDLTPGTWFFGVAAFTTAGVESAISGLASKTIH